MSRWSTVAVRGVVVAALVTAVPVARSATFTVDSTADAVDVAPGDGVCATAGNACTLRAAVHETNGLAGADVILVPPGVYALTLMGATDAGSGDLDVRDDLTIVGASSATTILDGNGIGRVLDVASGSTVVVTDVTIRGGNAKFPGDGDLGGGIIVAAAKLTLVRAVVTDNVADQQGGGICNSGGILVVRDTAIVGNTGRAHGGGIYQRFFGTSEGETTLERSTVSGNFAFLSGGGLRIETGNLQLFNSTVSGNTRGGMRIGIGADIVFLWNSTFADNIEREIHADVNVSAQGSIISGECSGTIISYDHNLFYMPVTACTHGVAAGDVVGMDPMLGPLADNGGPTATHAPLAGSPAIDAGGTVDCQPHDQRHVPRPIGTACDIGSVETGCGNGLPDAGEACDDGDYTSGDGCDSNCTPTACGNGIRTGAEQCDDGNLTSGDGCDANCTVTRCQNGIVTAGEACDDGNATNGDGCDANCSVSACGNGVVGPPETCDDGNTVGGDCCSASCQLDPPGTPCPVDFNQCTRDECNGAGACVHPIDDSLFCSDFDPCTSGDQCSAGTCVSGASCDPCLVCGGSGCVAPTGLGCQPPRPGGGASVLLKDLASNPAGDKLTWKWRSSAVTPKPDFGSPNATTDYRLCVYDGADALVLSAAAPAGGSCGTSLCWREQLTGWSYLDKLLTPDGILKLTLREGGVGQAKIGVKGKGPNLDLPPLGLTAPVTVRLSRSDGPQCWEAKFVSSTSTSAVFKSRSD